MISIETGGHNTDGIADLEEAVALAKAQGIANARGAINREALWPLFSLGDALGAGMFDIIPGISDKGSELGGISVRSVDTAQTPSLLRSLLIGVESAVTRGAGDALPEWRPTQSRSGVRLVTMQRTSEFREHPDVYEGLVASVQFDITGKKVMRARVNDGYETVPVATGDVTLFAGDTFSERSRVPHGFSFSGLYAVAFTLGQDPFYTISGRLPLLEENPQYWGYLRRDFQIG